MDKKVVIIIGVVIAVGAVLGLGMAGIVPIPGLSPAKKKKHVAVDANAEADAKKAEKAAAATAEKAKLASEAAEKKADDNKKQLDDEAAKAKALAEQKAADEKGYKKLAEVWAEMKPSDVSSLLVSHYKPEEAAPILKLMDTEQVAAIFTAMAASSTPAVGAAAKPD